MTFTRVTTASEGGRASFAPSLSADGRRVALCSDSDFLGQGIPKEQYEIWLYDTTTMTLTRVTTASEGDRDSFEPSLSADGTGIAFSSDSDFVGQGIPDEQYEVWLYDTATMTFTRVTTASESDRASHWPSLSADGTRIAFQSDSDFLEQGISRYQYEIWLYDTTAMTLTRVTAASDNSRSSLEPGLNAPGTRIAFHSDSDFWGQGIQNDQFEIWLYDTATVTFTRVTTASESNRDSFLASLNADGKMLALYSDSDFLGQSILDNQFEIWLYDGYYRAYLPLVVKQSL